jgi:hypothetical protein
MPRLMIAVAVFALSVTTLVAAPRTSHTWSGRISDSMCGATHSASNKHGGTKMTAHDCAEGCIKQGAQYVFVAKGHVYEISNQTFADLDVHAGHSVRLTGQMTGNSIAVSGIGEPKTGKKSK